ncbi:MAG: MFS transporter [Candidatus Hydrogenedentota bacterium]
MRRRKTKNGAPLPPEARRALWVIFLTLFIDLVGFSIIFPLFPAMLTFYRDTAGDTGLFAMLYSALDRLTGAMGSPEGEWGIIVLFGGALGAVYSLLQFLFAPIIGRLSDRYGRRPVLLVGLTGMALSHALWFFAGSFGLLVVARLLGGAMSGNIATATAVVADVTDQRNRSRGMAIIGIAFGFGFIGGPVLGGVLASVDLTHMWPGLARWGVNPFSMPAAAAMLLALFNVSQLAFRFRESRPAGAPYAGRVRRTANPLALFRLRGYGGVGRVNAAYFLFFVAFSGMEFTLTFLAVDRLGYTPRQNAWMFLFVGTLSALVQGGYVRRLAPRIGARAMALHGLICTAPGLLLIGAAGQWQSATILYAGLALLALGMAQVAPCFTALASVYAPPEEQGRALGAFRSVGALSRAVGPLIGAVLYWRLGGGITYLCTGLFIVLPFGIALTFPPEPDHAQPTDL